MAMTTMTNNSGDDMMNKGVNAMQRSSTLNTPHTHKKYHNNARNKKLYRRPVPIIRRPISKNIHLAKRPLLQQQKYGLFDNLQLKAKDSDLSFKYNMHDLRASHNEDHH